MSLAPHRTRSTSSSTFSCVPGLQRLLTSRNPCADPRERGGGGYTCPEPLTGDEPNRIVHNQIIIEQEDITWTEDRVMPKLCPTTSHCCLLLKILLKALLRLKKQSWTTNKFVLCWLHHGTYPSRNDRKCITLKEKA